MPSVGRWYVLSSVVRRYISFIVSGTSMNYPFYIISGTVVYLFMPSVERWYVLSSVVRRYISSYHQWYDGVISVNGRLAFWFRMQTFSSPVKEDVPLFSSP